MEIHIGLKWVFKKKIGSNGSVEKFKVRLVMNCFSQVEVIDYGYFFLNYYVDILSISFITYINVWHQTNGYEVRFVLQ